MSHTPGPWTAVDRVGAGWEIQAKVPQLPDVKDPITIYHTMPFSGEFTLACAPWTQFPKPFVEEMFETNSKLIAASPDLLAALKEAWFVHPNQCGSYKPDVECDCWVSRAKAAIAKAEGVICKS